MTAIRMKLTLLITTIILILLSFSSCKKEEQGRLLIYDKGNYLGPKDQKLNKDKVYKLQKQTNRQRDLRT